MKKSLLLVSLLAMFLMSGVAFAAEKCCAVKGECCCATQACCQK